MIHLKSIQFDKAALQDHKGFPFNLPVLQAFGPMRFTAPLTFFVGENGSGKSTILEAIACAAGSITVGSESVETDATLEPIQQLARCFKLVWQKKTRRGFFLRAEDFFGFAKRITQIREGLRADLRRIEQEYAGRPEHAKSLARMPYVRELEALKNAYAEGLDAGSHGENFFTLFESRFVPDGLYLIDEPEAPLSPLRQLSLISLLKEMLAQKAQFIIATHSPILLAFPGALIYSFDGGKIQPVRYENLEHVNLTRDFLLNPEAFLRRL